MTSDSHRFVITGAVEGDRQAIKAALLPFVTALLLEQLEEQGLEPINEEAALDLHAEVQARALGEMDNTPTPALVQALLEQAIPAGVEGVTVTLEAVDVPDE